MPGVPRETSRTPLRSIERGVVRSLMDSSGELDRIEDQTGRFGCGVALACLLVCSACGSGADGGGGASNEPACAAQYPVCATGVKAAPKAPSIVTVMGTMGNDSFDVTCDFSSSTNSDRNFATYCRWESSELEDNLMIGCRLADGAFWDDVYVVLDGFKAPGTFQNTTTTSDPPPEFNFSLHDYDRPTAESLYTNRTGFVGATLNLGVFDLCAGRATGTIDGTWNADQGGVLPGVAHLSFDVTF